MGKSSSRDFGRWYAGAVNCPVCHTMAQSNARFCGACGSTIVPSHGGQPPIGALPTAQIVGREIAGRYRITRKLGEGGMGAVYLAEQLSLKRQVALKVLRPELSSIPGLVVRFNAEAKLAAKLNHPNTVTLYDFGQTDDGALFIAMEFVEGQSLRQVLSTDAPLSTARIISICTQVCGSLANAHASGIVHRDLKPDNVMLSRRGKYRDVVSVLDFGIAKLREDSGKLTQQPMTQAGELLGTPQYMAPEQITGGAINARTDIYALGIMLYEMATGCRPFEGNTVVALLSKHLTETAVAPRLRRPERAIDRRLSDLIMGCMAKDPKQRPPDMDSVEECMHSWGRDSTVPLSEQQPGMIAIAATQLALPEQPGGPATPPQYAGYPMPTTPHQSPGVQHAPAPRRSRMWIAVPLLALLPAAGIGVFLYAEKSPSVANSPSPTAPLPVQPVSDSTFDMSAWEDGVGGEETAPTGPSKRSQTPAKPERHIPVGRTYIDASYGYTLYLPAGFVGGQQAVGFATFVGRYDGGVHNITSAAWEESGTYSERQVTQAIRQQLTGLGYKSTAVKWKNMDAYRVLTGQISGKANERGDFVLTRLGNIFYFVAVTTPKHNYKQSRNFRREFFSNHIELPSQ